jgi:hypothetical protein
LFILIKTKAKIDHAKNARLAYMIITHDLEEKGEAKTDSGFPDPIEYDPLGGP